MEVRPERKVTDKVSAPSRPFYRLGAAATLLVGIYTLGSVPSVQAQDAQMTCANAPNKITPNEYRQMDAQSAKYRLHDNPQLARYNPALKGPDPKAAFGDAVDVRDLPGRKEVLFAALGREDVQNRPLPAPALFILVTNVETGVKRTVGSVSLASVEAQYQRTHGGRKPGGYRLVTDKITTNTAIGWEFQVFALPVAKRGGQPELTNHPYAVLLYPSQQDPQRAAMATGLVCQEQPKVAMQK